MRTGTNAPAGLLAMLGLGMSLAVLSAIASARPASAQVHFTTPVPSFDEARASAKQQGKALILEFSATWCGPCKALARETRKPRAQKALELVHLVVYNGEEEPGSTLMQKFSASGFPSFIVLDENGDEATRKVGFGLWNDFEEWLKGVPDQALTLEAQRKAADQSPTNGKLQASVAARLLRAERYADAQVYYLRAQKAGPKEVAAQAAWVLLQLQAREQQHKAMRKPAAQLVTSFPGTKESARALRYLATIPALPEKELDALLTKQMDAASEASSLNALAFTAMKAGAFKAAQKIAQKLESLAKGKAAYLDTLAEVAFYAEGRADKAIALEERAIEAATVSERVGYTANLERFRRDKHEPSSELTNFSPPSLDPQPERRSGSNLSVMTKVRRALNKELRESCWQAAGSVIESVTFLVLSAAQPGEHRVIAPVSAAPELVACVTKRVQATEIPAGEILTLSPELLPLAFEERLEEVRGAAEDDCAAKLGKGEKSRRLRAVLRAEAGKPIALHFALDSAGKPFASELRECIEQSFQALKAPRPLLTDLSFELKRE